MHWHFIQVCQVNVRSPIQLRLGVPKLVDTVAFTSGCLIYRVRCLVMQENDARYLSVQHMHAACIIPYMHTVRYSIQLTQHTLLHPNQTASEGLRP